jgi:predicted metal-dependent HD superfamily phosphohydrolase
LSILGASDAIFDAYETGVRHEYKEIPIDLFSTGRAAILQGFLARDRLYLSDWGYQRFEAKARANLARSIAALLASD